MPLITIVVTTTQGATYVFPDVERSAALDRALREVAHAPGSDILVLANASNAILTVPMRIVAQVGVAGESEPVAVRSR